MSAPVPIPSSSIAHPPPGATLAHLAPVTRTMTDDDWRAMCPATTDISPLSPPVDTPLAERDDYCAYARLPGVMAHFEGFSCVNLS